MPYNDGQQVKNYSPPKRPDLQHEFERQMDGRSLVGSCNGSMLFRYSLVEENQKREGRRCDYGRHKEPAMCD